MPEWLLKEEQYEPIPDRDSFIDKSILSLLGILSRIRAQSGIPSGKHFVHAPFKVACTFLLVILLSLSKSLFFILTINVALLAVTSLLPADKILRILKAGFAAALFTLVILLPSAFWGNRYGIVMLPLKVFAAVTAVNILSRTTQWRHITGALKTFFLPDIFIFVLDITIRYIFMLGEFSLPMLYALKLRSVGKNNRKYASLSGIAGTMFIKSKEMAEEMNAAMECRGFTGEYRKSGRIRMNWADAGYLLVHILALLIFLYLG